LDYNTYYYWKVIAKDPKGAQTSSGVRVFKTQMPPNNPPEVPSNGWPSNNVTNMPLDLTLSWSCSDPDGDTLSFDLYFGTTTNPPKILSGYKGTSYTLHGLRGSETYYWKVVAKDDKGGITSGPIWSFETEKNNDPYSPSLTNPTNGWVNGVTLSWSSPIPADPDEDSVYYDLYFGTTPNPPLYVGHLYGTSYTLPRLNYSTTYHWKVIARDGKGGSASSLIGSFTTKSNQQPNINSIGAEIQSRANVTLSWDIDDPNNDDWQVDVYLGTSQSNLNKIASGLTSSSYKIKDILAADTTYYWKIVVKDEGGLSRESSVYSFTTGKW
ncbi:MAG: fibronectin type III domain-containing protein, partial [Thermotogae bacterium]|nr:fibronectin type III domain-containing protein [Thermotogota bacterium]